MQVLLGEEENIIIDGSMSQSSQDTEPMGICNIIYTCTLIEPIGYYDTYMYYIFIKELTTGIGLHNYRG